MTEAPAGITIRAARPAEAAELGDLMTKEVHWGTMPKLGRRFVALVHSQLISSPHALCLVADAEGKVAGYAAGLLRCSKFQREFMLRKGFAAALAVIPRLLSPSVIRIALRLGTYFYRAPAKDPDSEMVALAVNRDFGRRGIGRYLTEVLLERMAQSGCEVVKVGTVDVDNKASNRIFERLGAIVVRQEEFSAGSPVNVYYWRPGGGAAGDASDAVDSV